MIELSTRGVVRFALSGPAAQRKILRDYKFPDPEGAAQARYYRDTFRVIGDYHRYRHDTAWLDERADALEVMARNAGGAIRSRLHSNAAAIREYQALLPAGHYALLAPARLALSAHGVRVRVSPELHVLDGNREMLIVLLPGDKVTEEEARLHAQIVCEAADQVGLGISPRNVVALTLRSAQQFSATSHRVRVRRDLDAALQNVSALWPSIAAA